MATKLNRQLKRETDAIQVNGKHRGRKLIIEIHPHGDKTYVLIRVKGTREGYSGSVSEIFRMLMIRTMNEDFKKRMTEYAAKKKLGKRCRKPVKPFLNF